MCLFSPSLCVNVLGIGFSVLNDNFEVHVLADPLEYGQRSDVTANSVHGAMESLEDFGFRNAHHRSRSLPLTAGLRAGLFGTDGANRRVERVTPSAAIFF